MGYKESVLTLIVEIKFFCHKRNEHDFWNKLVKCCEIKACQIARPPRPTRSPDAFESA